ncbi:MAG: glycosyltransferase family 2 protein [Bacteroidales bacterium]|jgi:GT2 family glycosyltransferase
MTNQDTGIFISIIIVNYNSGSLLKDCIASIFDNVDDGYEIIIYDNASSDNSLQMVSMAFPGEPRIRILEGNDNLGFAKANNQAASAAKGKYLHFLNPDILVNPALAADYIKVLDGNKNTVYVTNLADEKGKPLKNRHIIPTLNNYFNCIFRKEKVAYWNIGASLIISCDAFDLIGGWPEDYFMYAEDLDLFYSIHRHKLNISYLDTQLIHLGKGATRNIWNESERTFRVELSFRRFYRKYGISWQYFFLRPIQLVFILFHEPQLFPLHLKTYFRTIFSNT